MATAPAELLRDLLDSHGAIALRKAVPCPGDFTAHADRFQSVQ
jgi:hypothetical protein